MHDVTPEMLEQMLKDAATAHHTYEASLGHPDATWQRWYAQFIYDTLHATAQGVDVAVVGYGHGV